MTICCLFQFAALSEEQLFDFEDDPIERLLLIETTQPDFIWGQPNKNPWGAKGNDSNGYLSLSEASSNNASIVVFPELLDGSIAKRFKVTMDVRTGNGTTDLPGNGFSINFVRSNDPLLTEVEEESLNPNNTAIAEFLEIGTRTGLSISFDTWEGNTLPDSDDLVGLIVRVDNRTVGKFPLPFLNGDTNNLASIQTGPQGGSLDAPRAIRGDPNILGWSPLVIEMDEIGNLNLSYKGEKIIEDFDSGFFPSLGHFVVMGRTSEVNEIQHLDNVYIEVEPAEHWLFADLAPNATGFVFTFRNIGESRVIPDTIQIILDGDDISSELSLDSEGELLIATWSSEDAFESGSEHFLEVSASGTDGHFAELMTTFNAPRYTTIPSDMVLKQIDVTNDGFLLFVKQSEDELENNVEARLEHLVDSSLNTVDTLGARTDTWLVKLINFDMDGFTAGSFRSLGDGTMFDVIDDFIPGIPGLTGSSDNVTAMIQTVVRIPDPGFYTFGFRSGAGFQATAGNNPESRILLGEYDGVRKDSATEYQVFFESAGDYAMQALWFSGDGNANFEWYTTSPSVALLNDTEHGGIQTFAALPVIFSRISELVPADDAINVPPNIDVKVVIEDVEATVVPDTVKLTLSDGSEAQVSKSGRLTSVIVEREGALWEPGQLVTGRLEYKAGNEDEAINWSFRVEDYPILTKDKTILGTGEDSGFQFRVLQSIPDRGNSVLEAEQHLNGTWRMGREEVNTANPSGGFVSEDPNHPGIIFEIDSVINFDQDAHPIGNFFQNGDGGPTDRLDGLIPGIPGVEGRNDSITAEILTFVEFPSVGYYQMIFNSADGFRVTEEHGAGDEVGIELGVFDGKRDSSDTKFGFKVVETGLYPIRAVWFAGGGQANLEWASTDGSNMWLLNDSDTSALKAYRTRSGVPVDVNLNNISKSVTSASYVNGNVVIEFEGTLKSSESITGDFIAVEGATSPYSVAPSKAAEFYIAE